MLLTGVSRHLMLLIVGMGGGIAVAFGGNDTSGPRDVSTALNAKGGAGRMDFESETLIAHTLTGGGFDASEDGTGRGTPIVPIDLRQASRGEKMTNNRAVGSGGAPGHGIGNAGDPAFTVSERGQAIAFDTTQITSKENRCQPVDGGPCHPLAAHAHAPALALHTRQDPCTSDIAFAHDATHPAPNAVHQSGWAVRRLTPLECERLQGFPDGWTDVPYRGKRAADGPRYKALGNSMAVNCMYWIGQRIDLFVRTAA